jgi:hypothetical protein
MNIVTYATEQNIHFLSMGLEWNRIHYYCGHLLAHGTSPG